MTEIKICDGPCGLEKSVVDFRKNRNVCKKCEQQRSKKYHASHKQQDKNRRKNYYETHKKQEIEKATKYNKIHGQPPKEKIQRTEEEKAQSKKAYMLEYNKKNKSEISKQHKEYRKNNKEAINTQRNIRQKERRMEDINFKIIGNLRSRLNDALSGNYKIGSAVEYLGCSVDELKSYLESKFYINVKTNKQMAWENYGTEWHIDHVIPLATFDLTDENQFYRSCYYTNLQPLWKEDNIEKSDSLTWDWE